MEGERTPLLRKPSPIGSSPNLATQSSGLQWDPVRGTKAATCVLLALTLERLAYYALLANLLVFLSLGGNTPKEAMTAVLVVGAIAHFSALGGGWLADGALGRYWTLILGLGLYVIGFAMLTAVAGGILWSNTHASLPQLYIIFTCIGVAAGTVRANFPSFGAEQVRHGGGESVRKFFNWYYWCVNSGSLLGVGFLSLVAQEPATVAGGFLAAWGGAGAGVTLALVLLAVGKPYYVIYRPGSSPLLSTLRILHQGISGCWNLRKSNLQRRSPALSSRSNPNPVNSPSWLDYAKMRYGGSHHDSTVEDVKKLGSVLLLLLLLLPYWLVFFQIETGFQEQGVHLKIGLAPDNTFNIPTSWLSLFDQLFILGLIPLLNGFVYPALDRRGVRVTLFGRIAVGMALSLCAAVSAGLLETISMQHWHDGHHVEQIIHNRKYNSSDVSVLWQVPQYCLVGMAEVFAGVAGLEYVYSTAPKPLQAVAMGLLSAVEGIGSLLGTALIGALSPAWIPQDRDHFQGHLDYYFFLLAGIQGVTLVGFTISLIIKRGSNSRTAALPDSSRISNLSQTPNSRSSGTTVSSSTNTVLSS
ncbi:solute carrier family 15 member 4-like isoform X2 [Frankliniella occidentalis]|uniref:Solute carrier family 15 member 4-like isoform X2 n=1 Tax=Frankliniella occidentalis TaxID=133901 RepID=A0A6J1SE86_FRAOC|nr:solute carrier family 15 member 4-like isoform X2 [Frankliniella occidentalis]